MSDFENRSNATKQAIAGGALLGSGAYANYRNEKAFKNTGKLGLWDATKARKLSGVHGKFVAGKLGARTLQVAGLPMLAYGAKHLVKPEDTKKFNVKTDVIKPVVSAATFADQVRRKESQLSKADDSEKIISARRRAKNLARVSGTLGLAALGTRSPEFAGVIARRATKANIAVPKQVTRLIAKEPQYTKASNALGVGAIGVGSIGSFNFARLQGLEAKKERNAVAKGLYKMPKFSELSPEQQQRIFARMTPERRKNLARINDIVRARKVERGIDPDAIKKRDDKFIRQYRDRISPEAESGYKYLKRGVNSQRLDAAAEGTLGTGLIAYSAKDLRHKNKTAAGLGALGGALAIKAAYNNASRARAWNAKANKIKARAVQRETDGEWGRNRQVTVAKGLMSVRIPKLAKPFPKGSMRRPGITPGHLRRTRFGKIVSVNGSVR